MIKFNSILRDEGLDPAGVKLVRHQDTRFSGRPSPYHLWRAADGRFEIYQRIQSRPKLFAGAQFLASFLATPLDETMFVGIFANKGLEKAPRGLIDPVSNQNVSDHDFYDLELTSHLADYRGRLIIEWGEGYRAWVQRATVQDKPVIEIKRTISDPPFPGFMDFNVLLSDLASVPPFWRAALSAVGGIYLLTNPKTGKQYVGSASGSAGFWGRWENYVESGHGGNLRMKELPAADYQLSVLEVSSSSTSIEELILLESRWKNKFLTRKFGLNAN